VIEKGRGLNYHWTDCPNCRCQVAINTSAYPEKISGSLRRWSTDRTINDGRRFEIATASLLPDGGFATACVCGQQLSVSGKPSAVGGGREEGLRVDLSR